MFKPLEANPLNAALEAVKRFDEAYRRICCKTKCPGAQGLARRAKELPQLILQVGLVPALTFFLSKLDEMWKRKAYQTSIKLVLGEKIREEDQENICRDLNREGGGYPQALAIVLAYAASLLCKGSTTCEYLNKVSGISSGLVEVLEALSGKIAVEMRVLAYATEVKKLVTALYEE